MRMNGKKITVVLIGLLVFGGGIFSTMAQKQFTSGFSYELRGGLNIGGTAPLPIPAEIRKIKSYAPGLCIVLEGVAEYACNSEWGIRSGIRLESKGMTTRAGVKNYGMVISNEEGGQVEGLWTGDVETRVRLSYISVPLLVVYRPTDRLHLSAGPFLSYLMEGDFYGSVSDGHLRTPDATGRRIDFRDGHIASYDFSNHLRRWQVGMQVGGSWQAYKHLTIHTDLLWGLQDIFQPDFKTVAFSLYPLYLSVGFGYRF